MDFSFAIIPDKGRNNFVNCFYSSIFSVHCEKYLVKIVWDKQKTMIDGQEQYHSKQQNPIQFATKLLLLCNISITNIAKRL